jgi:hypothetical protein
LGLLLIASGQTCSGELPDAGLLVDEFPLTLESGSRTETLGPLLYWQEKESEHSFGIPPLFSHVSDPEIERTEVDFAYPLLTYDRYGTEFRWQLIQLFSISGGENQEELQRTRFTIFPLYFQQRSVDPDQNYTALAPLYGHLKNRLLRDEIFFVLFPLYGRTQNRDVTTHNYLYPLFHVRHGNALSGWQFWPLVGSEHKGITTRTNGFGEIETIGGHEKYFALWPIYFNELTGIGTENPQKMLTVLPFFNLQRSPQRDATGFLYPLFNMVDDRKRKYREWQSPWPFVIFARGEGKTTSRVWPFFSSVHTETIQTGFYLWPIYKYRRFQAKDLERDGTRILFFLYSDITEKDIKTQAIHRRADLWPLFIHRREYDGSTRLQLIAPLEPILPASKSIERNYSPLWSVWRSQKNPAKGTTSQSFLWNLYRRENNAGDKKCSFLFGVFQYQSIAGSKRLRLLYVPVIKTKGRAENDPENAAAPK